jgi:hypothetical protein
MEKTTNTKLVLTDEEMEEAEKYLQDPGQIQLTKEIIEQNSALQECNNSRALEKFDTYLLQAIEEGLLVLGEPIKNSIFLTLEIEFCIKKVDIPKKINDFSAIIHKIIGLGAFRLESLFITQLITKLKIDIHTPNNEYNLSKWLVKEISFTDYIHMVRKEYMQSENK